MIVAMNKIDAEGAQPEKVKDQLARENVLVEGYGGTVPIVETSATQKRGIDELLEMVLLVSELHELTAAASGLAKAVVIESHQDPKRGALASVIVQSGMLQTGDVILATTSVSKVRALMDDKGKSVKSAGPSTPVEILGLREVPTVGSFIEVYPNEKAALAEARTRLESAVEPAETGSAAMSVDELFAAAAGAEQRELKLLVKADTQGSLEAIVASIEQMENEGNKARFILKGTGTVTESDVLLAATSGALVLAFRVGIDQAGKNAINQEKVMVQQYDIIYQLLEDVEDVLASGVPIKEVHIKGRAEVLQTFELTSGDVVAGCRVTDGLMRKGWNVKVTRGDEVVVEDALIDEVRHGRDKINEAKKNSECGILIKPNFQFRAGDVIEVL
jgi:translation initiation factor IF-2